MKAILNVTLIWALCLSVCQAQKSDLTFNLKKGKEYGQVMSSKATVIQEFNGQTMNLVMNISGGMVFKVVSVGDSEYDMKVWYESLTMKMDMPQGKMEFSSENGDEGDLLSTILSKMVGTQFDMKMSKGGKVLNVNMAPMMDAAFANFPDLPEDKVEQIKAQLSQAYGDEAFRGNIEMVTGVFPDYPVNKGDKWTLTTNLEGGLSALMTTDYEFSEVTDDYALIKGVSVIETADKDAYIETNGMSLRYDLTGSMLSEIKVDKETGWIIESDIHQEMKGDAYIKPNPNHPDGMKIPITMVNEMVITGK